MKFYDYKFGDLASFRYGKMPDKKKILSNGKYPIFSGYRYVGFYDEFNINAGQLIIVARGVGGTGDVKLSTEKCFLTNLSIAADIQRQDVVSVDFLYYYFLLHNLRYLDSGSAQSQITISDLEKLIINIPEYEQQQKIAAVLSALDSKIEQNTAINNNLEQQAQALFQQYFGSKEPNGSINDILDEMPKSKIKVGDAKDVRGPYPFFTSGQNILEYTEALVDGRNIFLNTGGNADVKYYIGPAAYSTDTWCIKAKNDMTDMLYLLLKGMQSELDSIYFEGSALRHLQKPKLKSLAIYIPTDEELKTFNSIVASLFNKIAANVAENKILEHTRDVLLPKLMSGEIDVSEVDISDPSCLDKSLFNKETE